jgi:hypothetical protein
MTEEINRVYFEKMSEYWAGVIVGCCFGAILMLVMMFVIIEQNNRLRAEVAELKEMVEEHKEVIEQYKFYNWHNMKFFEEIEK